MRAALTMRGRLRNVLHPAAELPTKSGTSPGRIRIYERELTQVDMPQFLSVECVVPVVACGFQPWINWSSTEVQPEFARFQTELKPAWKHVQDIVGSIVHLEAWLDVNR